MANAIYPKYKEAVLQGSSDSSLINTVKVALVDTGTYSYNSAHDFYDDISTSVVATPVILMNKTYSDGVLDADDITFTSVSGNTIEAIVFYIDTGTPSTSRLVAYMDTGITGLPVTPNGGDITITWNPLGIFGL